MKFRGISLKPGTGNGGGTGGDTISGNILVSLSGGKTLGRYTNGQTIPSAGLNIDQFANLIAKETQVPTLTNPSTGSFAFNVANQIEVGTIIPTLTISALFSRGSINPQYTATSPFRSGLPNTHKFTGAGGMTENIASISLNPTKSINNYSVALAANTFGIQVAYDGGVQPKDSDGNNFGTPLGAGDSNIAQGTITGSYLQFYGSVLPSGSLPTNSATVRALTNSTFGTTFSIVIPAGHTKISFAYPATRANIIDSSVKYVEGFNSNVGNTFTQSIFNVNDAGGNPVSYKVYTVTLAAPESSAITYNVILP